MGRNRKPKTFKLYDPIFDVDILVCVATRYEDAQIKWRHKGLGQTKAQILPNDSATRQACVFKITEHKSCCIWFKDVCPGARIVAHEAFHATCHVLGFSGLSLNDGSEEAYAYFLAWIVREIGNRVW